MVVGETSGSTDGQELNNIPGRPMVWKIGNKVHLIYVVPGTDPPIYMSWESPSLEDTQSWFGPGEDIVVDRRMTQAEADAMGVLDFGSTDELANLSADPFSGWAAEIEMQAQSQPWILDEDYQALMAQAILEKRAVTPAELKTTRWWRENTSDQRDWMITYHGDPETAQQQLEDRRLEVKDMLVAAGGGTNISDAVINYMADQWTMGNWSQVYFNNQVRAITDPSSGIEVDAGLAKIEGTDSVDTTISKEDRVRDLLHQWLGPALGDWSDDQIAEEAGKMRNDDEYEQRFIEGLKDQRMAMLPEHTDREMSYQQIANTWKQWWMGQWGEMPDEKDPLFMNILQTNDMVEGAATLRREGLDRGIAKVESDLSNFGAAIGGSVRGGI